MQSDVILNKVAAIERALKRVAEEYRGDPGRLDDLTVQDAIILNLQRACESSIDLAMHVVAARRLGVPQDTRNAFALLKDGGVLGESLMVRLQAMVGFRNIAIHEYQQIQVSIVQRILDERLGDFIEFTQAVMSL
jgi:uncharacterized protein YutE (UPF0331/DUF86 family)